MFRPLHPADATAPNGSVSELASALASLLVSACITCVLVVALTAAVDLVPQNVRGGQASLAGEAEQSPIGAGVPQIVVATAPAEVAAGTITPVPSSPTSAPPAAPPAGVAANEGPSEQPDAPPVSPAGGGETEQEPATGG
jgi:hypothetical protein